MHADAQPVGPDALHWLAEGEAAGAAATGCPVCGDPGPHPAILRVASLLPPHRDLLFLRCGRCGSGHYDPPGVTSFTELGGSEDEFWRFYVEIGGGVWETIWPILADRRAKRGSLLDVGCGFGFAVDFWQRRARGEAVGVELASYGRVGAKMLGITVHDRVLDEIPSLDGRRFDVVYASEVIEHVPDPAAFVALLSRYVADDGVLVLTTPSMSYVSPANHSMTLVAALAPGLHGFLLSKAAFEDAARRAGFMHVVVRSFGERQILWASRREVDVDATPGRIYPDYLDYLDGRIADGDAASPVWQGLAYRALKHRMDTGHAAEGRALALRLLEAVARARGDHVRDPQRLSERYEAAADLDAVGRIAPFFMPGFAYQLGAIALNVDRDFAAAERWFRACVACTTAAASVHAVFFVEASSLVWPARATLADLALRRGDIDAGADGYARLAAEGAGCTAANGYAVASRELLERRVPMAARALLEQGHLEPTGKVLGAYGQYVAYRYGASLLDAGGVDRALASGDPVPLDPLFAPWLGARLAHARHAADARRALDEVGEVAARWSADSQHGARMRDEAAVIRRILEPAPASRTVWSATYVVKPPDRDRR